MMTTLLVRCQPNFFLCVMLLHFIQSCIKSTEAQMAIEHLTSKYALDYSSQRHGGLRYDDHCVSLTC